MTTGKEMIPIMICTEKRGVFVGMCEDPDAEPQILYDAQMIVEWSEETHGVMGIASRGPAEGSKIGPPVPSLSHKQKEITCVIRMTEQAIIKCREEPWG